MKVIFLLLVVSLFTEAHAQTDHFPDEIETVFGAVDQPSFADSRLKFVHPVGGRSTGFWVYWIEDIPGEHRDTIAIHALAHTPGTDWGDRYAGVHGCHFRRELAPNEARFLDLLVTDVVWPTHEPHPSDLKGVCLDGAPAFIKVEGREGTLQVERACGSRDTFALIRDFVEAMIHPIYSRPYESCAQNQTPQYIVSEENIEE